MANLAEKVKYFTRKSSNSPSLGWIELKDWKLKKNSLWCIALGYLLASKSKEILACGW